MSTSTIRDDEELIEDGPGWRIIRRRGDFSTHVQAESPEIAEMVRRALLKGLMPERGQETSTTGDRLTRRVLELAVRHVGRATSARDWPGEISLDDVETVLAAARRLLDQRPASEEEIRAWARRERGLLASNSEVATLIDGWREGERRLGLPMEGE